MNTKFFAVGLVAAAANAVEIASRVESIPSASGKQTTNAPRIKLRGPYFSSRPWYKETVEEYAQEKEDGASTDDDRYSSSDSDSVSSSDENLPSSEESTCERDGDIYACLRKQNADACYTLQTFNEDTCLCEQDYACPELADAYGDSTCPFQNYGLTPFTSPLDNCACQSQAERDAMYNYEHAGHCRYAPEFKRDPIELNKIRICSPDTDSESDCVKIGDLRRRVSGSYNQKQWDDAGHVDSSIYTDSDCDPRYSSCDTNSNEEFSNTDSNTEETVRSDDYNRSPSAKVLRKRDPLKGRLADRYARKYGVRLPKKHGRATKPGEIDTRSFDTDSDITSYDRSNPG